MEVKKALDDANPTSSRKEMKWICFFDGCDRLSDSSDAMLDSTDRASSISLTALFLRLMF